MMTLGPNKSTAAQAQQELPSPHKTPTSADLEQLKGLVEGFRTPEVLSRDWADIQKALLSIQHDTDNGKASHRRTVILTESHLELFLKLRDGRLEVGQFFTTVSGEIIQSETTLGSHPWLSAPGFTTRSYIERLATVIAPSSSLIAKSLKAELPNLEEAIFWEVLHPPSMARQYGMSEEWIRAKANPNWRDFVNHKKDNN